MKVEAFKECCDHYVTILQNTDVLTEHGKKVLHVATSFLQESMMSCIKSGIEENEVESILKGSMKKLYK